jgi:hypothetical protein
VMCSRRFVLEVALLSQCPPSDGLLRAGGDVLRVRVGVVVKSSKLDDGMCYSTSCSTRM